MSVAASLEHVNITVNDPAKTADFLCKIFGWRIRWEGPAKDNGYTFHVGNDDNYLAIYSTGKSASGEESSYRTIGGLNHVGVVVSDLDAVEEKVLAAGLNTLNHGNYDPGRRFYFNDLDGIEFEVVSYT